MGHLDEALTALHTVLDEHDRPVATAVEVAEHLDVSRPTATNLLRQLDARGDVATDKVGRTRIWWPTSTVTPAKTPAKPPAKTPDEPPANTPEQTPEEDVRERMEDDLDELHVPGRKAAVEKTRRDAITWAWEYLREHETAESGEIANATFGAFFDETYLEYATSTRYPGYGLWDNCVRDRLKKLPGVEPPGPKGSTWRFNE